MIAVCPQCQKLKNTSDIEWESPMSKLIEQITKEGGVTLSLTHEEKSGKYVIWQQTTGSLFDQLQWLVIAPTLEQAKRYLEVYSR
jgi:hypothetical protein